MGFTKRSAQKVTCETVFYTIGVDRVRIISLPTTSIMTLLPLETSILCASNVVYLIDPTTDKSPVSFSASNDTVHTLIASSSNGENTPPAFLAAAENNLYINVFDMKSGSLSGSLIAGNDVEFVASSTKDSEEGSLTEGRGHRETVAAVTKDGVIELFSAAFNFEVPKKQTDNFSLKEIQKNKTHKATAFVKVVRPDKPAVPIPLAAVSFEGNDLVIVWIEAGVNPVFERVQWRSSQTGSLAFTGTKEITRVKNGPGLVTANTNGMRSFDQSRVDESRTVVVNGEAMDGTEMMLDVPEIIDISSAEEESDSDAPEHLQKIQINGDSKIGSGIPDAGSEADGEMEETEEQSFGDLLRNSAPETIDVAGAFDDADKQVTTAVGGQNMQLSSGMSLGTVLSQALRTNDLNLLESCLHFHDLNIIRATIERLPSVHATTLLIKLAERLHNRPGRAGSLMVWIQWTLIAHGGYLAGQPDVVRQLASLHRVVKERAKSLQPLLSLKGKLDMLDAQMNLRKSMQKRYGLDEEEDDEDAVIYVEGQEESSSQEDSGNESDPTKAISKNKGKSGKATITNGISSDSDEDMDDMPSGLNGIGTDSEDETSDSDSNPFIDREASETDDDYGDEFADDVDHDDVDSLDDEDEEAGAEAEVEEPPRKVARRPKVSNGIVIGKK